MGETGAGFWFCVSCRFKISDEENDRLFRMQNENSEEKWIKTMKVSYNGVTGELVKLEKKSTDYHIPPGAYITEYSLSIYDSEKRATTTFEGVNLEDVKFMGGAVSFS